MIRSVPGLTKRVRYRRVVRREADKILSFLRYLHSFISTYMRFLVPSVIKLFEKLINKSNRRKFPLAILRYDRYRTTNRFARVPAFSNHRENQTSFTRTSGTKMYQGGKEENDMWPWEMSRKVVKKGGKRKGRTEGLGIDGERTSDRAKASIVGCLALNGARRCDRCRYSDARFSKMYIDEKMRRVLAYRHAYAHAHTYTGTRG